MIEGMVILISIVFIVFAFIMLILMKFIREIKGKAIVKIGMEAAGVKTYMEVDMQNNITENQHKEKE